LEEKLDDGIPPPKEKPLDDELLDPGTDMHADIAIAPRQHAMVVAIRVIQAMHSIIFPRRAFANSREPTARARQLGRPARSVLNLARRSYAMEPVRHWARAQNSHKWATVAGAVTLAACASAAAGCFTDRRPTEVMTTPVSTVIRPAKPADCNMPVLTQEPTLRYQQVAIVEAWADINEEPAKVLPELKRQACATGAQALLIVSGTKQDVKSLLYGVTPNESETQVTSANRNPNQAGDYINKMQYKPKIGEAGHNGYYIDALAIDYVTGDNTAAVGQPHNP
jgi:hypothetical protein